MNTASVRHLGVSTLTAALGLSLVYAAPASAQEHAGAHWSYEGAGGPTHWGDLEADYSACKVGHHQSPIDIQDPHPADLPAIRFDYKSMPLSIIDNGHTIQINAAPGNFITVGDHRYELKQFHFHHPSEEAINGKRTDMVAHLVHADTAGNLAVVAVLLAAGPDNALIQRLWQNLPATKGTPVVHAAVLIDPSGLLPPSQGYYTFSGSLTTPPCSEHVTWFVLKQHESISADQIARFAAIYPEDARPVQPTYGREVQATK